MAKEIRNRFGRLFVFALPTVIVPLAPAAGQQSPSVLTTPEREAIARCLAGMPPKVQVAVALIRDGGVRFVGAERTDPRRPRLRGLVTEPELRPGQRHRPAARVQAAGQVARVKQRDPRPGLGGGLP